MQDIRSIRLLAQTRELRDRETMQLTLNAADTGHLVLATLHSANVSEALQRILRAFSVEIREQTAAQLAQVLRWAA